MTRAQCTMLFSAVAFAIGFASNSFGVPGSTARIALLAANSKAAAAPTHVVDRVSADRSDLSDGIVEQYDGGAGGPDQGSGYGDVYDRNGHLLWRFAAVERGDSKWTILKYYSQRELERRNPNDANAQSNEFGSP